MNYNDTWNFWSCSDFLWGNNKRWCHY